MARDTYGGSPAVPDGHAGPPDPGFEKAHPHWANTSATTGTASGRASRGTYRWSWYYFLRSGVNDTYYIGPQPTMTKVEMDLLSAEALIRLNRASEAVPLINITRQANGELPGVTTAGPPEGDECVPRKVASGACGSLWDALMYEKNLEMTGIEGAVSWWDARGWGTLQEGTPVQLPVPGEELENLGLPVYTFGGNIRWGSGPAPVQRLPCGGEVSPLLIGGTEG